DGAIERELARSKMEPQMSHDLTLAQKAAWHLARTLMAPVVLFQVDDEFGVLPADELDEADVEILFEYDPYTGGRSVH
ncbi:MAG: helicase, partial [Devosia sp.]